MWELATLGKRATECFCSWLLYLLFFAVERVRLRPRKGQSLAFILSCSSKFRFLTILYYVKSQKKHNFLCFYLSIECLHVKTFPFYPVIGDTPYPGVENKDLFVLLKRGHRLEKPNSCSEEL